MLIEVVLPLKLYHVESAIKLVLYYQKSNQATHLLHRKKKLKTNKKYT